LKDTGIITAIKKEAKYVLDNGPEPWSPEAIAMKRYMLIDALEDFIGSSKAFVSVLPPLISTKVQETLPNKHTLFVLSERAV
jgi:hypothetical protein